LHINIKLLNINIKILHRFYKYNIIKYKTYFLNFATFHTPYTLVLFMMLIVKNYLVNLFDLTSGLITFANVALDTSKKRVPSNNLIQNMNNYRGGGVLLLFSDALGLCPFGVGACRLLVTISGP